MPAGDQIDCYLSCNVRINKGELKKKKKNEWTAPSISSQFDGENSGMFYNLMQDDDRGSLCFIS